MTIKYTSEKHKMKPEGEKFRDEQLDPHFMVGKASEIFRKYRENRDVILKKRQVSK